jgi:fucose permease
VLILKVDKAGLFTSRKIVLLCGAVCGGVIVSWLYVWFLSQTNEVKAAILGAIVAAVISVFLGVVVWLLFSIPKIIAWHYKRVLIDLEDTERSMKQESRPNTTIPEPEVMKRSGHWLWIIRRAKKWERIRKRFP